MLVLAYKCGQRQLNKINNNKVFTNVILLKSILQTSLTTNLVTTARHNYRGFVHSGK